MATNDGRPVPPGNDGPPRSKNPYIDEFDPSTNPYVLEDQVDSLSAIELPDMGAAAAESTGPVPEGAPTDHERIREGVVLHEMDHVLEPLPEGVEPRRYELLVNNIRNRLAREGMPTDILDAMWQPFGSLPGYTVPPEAFKAVTNVADEMVRENPRAVIEFNEHLRSTYPDGYDVRSEDLLNRYGYSPIRSYLMQQNAEELEQRNNLAEGLRQVRKGVATVGAATVTAAQQPVILGTDFLDLGIRLLEWFRVATAAAVSTRPDETKSETYWRLRKKALPPVRTLNMRTGEEEIYFSRVGARFMHNWDRVKNSIEWAGATGLSGLMDLIGYDGGEEFFNIVARESGARAVDAARINSQITNSDIPVSYPLEILESSQSPEIVARFMTGPWTAVGRHMSKEEREFIVAKAREENSTWPVWAMYQDERYRGALANTDIAMMSGLGVGLEVAWDPVFLAGPLAIGTTKGARAVARWAAPTSTAQVRKQAALNMNHIEDIAESVKAQKYELFRAESEALQEIDSTGRILPETQERILKARTNLDTEMAALNRKSGAVAEDPTYPMRQEVIQAEDRIMWYVDKGEDVPVSAYDELQKARQALSDEALRSGALPIDREVIERTSPTNILGRYRYYTENQYQFQTRPDPDLVDLLPQDMQTPRKPSTETQLMREYLSGVEAVDDPVVTAFPDRQTLQTTPGLPREELEEADAVLKRLHRRNPEYAPDIKRKVEETREFAFEDVGLDLELRNEYGAFLTEVLPDTGALQSLSPEAQTKINRIVNVLDEAVATKGTKAKAKQFKNKPLPDRLAGRRRLAANTWQRVDPETGKTAERLLNDLILEHQEELMPLIRAYDPQSPLMSVRPVRPNTQGAYSLARETAEVSPEAVAEFNFSPITFSQETSTHLAHEYFTNASAYTPETIIKRLGSYGKTFIKRMDRAKALQEDKAVLHREIRDLRDQMAMIDDETTAEFKRLKKRQQTAQNKLTDKRAEYEKLVEKTMVNALKRNPEGFRSLFRGNVSEDLVDIAVYDNRIGPIGLGDEPIMSPEASLLEESTAGRARNQQTFFHQQKVSRTKSINELAEEKARVQERELATRQDFPLQVLTDEHGGYHPSTRQRQLFGQDDMEQGGDMLNHLVSTGGEAVEDIAIHHPNPLHSWDAREVRSTYEWQLVDDVTRVEAEMGLARRQGAQGELYLPDLAESATRSVARDQSRLAKAYGAARRLRLPQKEIDALEQQYSQVKAAAQQLGKKLKNKAERERFNKLIENDFDETWLPPQPKSAKQAGVVGKLVDEMPYYFTRALYPDSYHLTSRYKFYSVSQASRSPLRFFETHDPGMAEQLRLGYARFERDLTSDGETIRRIFERGGVAKSDLKEGLVVDKDRSRLLYDLLDNKRDSVEWKRLAEQADPELLRAHDELRKMLDIFADQQGLTGTSRYIEGYFRHVIDESLFDGGSRPLEFQGMNDNSFVFISHMLDRTSNVLDDAAKEDIVSIMDFYIRAKNRKTHLEPLFDDLNVAGDFLAQRYNDPMYKKYTSTLVHALQGKPSALTHFGLGRGSRMDQGLQALTTALWMATIPFNPRYGLMQMLSALTTTAARVGVGRTMRGMLSMFSKEGQGIARELGFYNTINTLMENNKLSGYADQLAKVTGVTEIEAFVRGVSSHAAIDMLLTKYGYDTWGQAVAAGANHRIMFEAMRMAENANHMYGPLARTPYLTAYLGQGLSSSMTQFQLFTVKQTEELYSIANQDLGKLVRYFALSGWLNRIFAQQVGYDVTQWTGAGYFEQALSGIESPAVDITNNLVDAMASVNTQNPEEVERAFSTLLMSIETFMPAIIRSAAKSAERLEEGVAKDSRGRKIRDMMLGENENITRSLLERFARGLQPQRFGENAQGVGGDLAPTLTMGPAIQDRMARQRLNAVKAENRQLVFSMRKDLDKILAALDEGDSDEAAQLAKDYADVYGINLLMSPDFERAVVNKAMADNLSKEIRYFIRNPKYIPFAIDVFKRSIEQQR